MPKLMMIGISLTLIIMVILGLKHNVSSHYVLLSIDISGTRTVTVFDSGTEEADRKDCDLMLEILKRRYPDNDLVCRKN